MRCVTLQVSFRIVLRARTNVYAGTRSATNRMTDAVPTEAIPESLHEYEQWICWRSEERNGEPTKLPVDPQTGSLASTPNPDTWADFETAHEYAESNEIGLGFVFTEGDSLVGVDLDKCRDADSGQPEEWAKDLVQELDSYTEVSPSGTGYHVLLEGELPEGGNRSGNVEMYEDARFFTVTGDHVEGTPEEIKERQQALEAVHREHIADEPAEEQEESTATPEATLNDEELLERAKSASNGEKFERLWNGSTSGYESHSEADMALVSMLAFWTGGDEAQVDRLFRQSGLMRAKWDERHFSDGSTYGERTIERAIRGTDEFYSPSGEGEARPEEPTSADEESSPATEAPAPQVNDRLVALEADVERLEARVSDLESENERLRGALEAQQEQNEELMERLNTLEEEGEQSGFVGRLFER